VWLRALLRRFIHALRRRSAGREVLAAGVVPAAVLIPALLGVVMLVASSAGAEVDRTVAKFARGQLERAVSDFRLTCQTASSEIARRVAMSLAVADEALGRAGGFALGTRQVRWRAVNQLDRGELEVTLPQVMLGGVPVARNTDFARPSPIVDEVQRVTGSAATLFQRMNERGDMLRVVTSVRDGAGRRAVGTYIPASGPDGPDPVVAAVLRGERYQGRAWVVDAWYVTAYEPLRSPAGRIEGMLFVGVRQDSLAAVRDAAATMRIGASGNLLVLGRSGAQRGRLLMGSGPQDGADIGGSADPQTGRAFIREMLDRAPALGPQEIGADAYTRRALAGAPAKRRIAAYVHFEPWDWVILAAMDESEAEAATREVRRALIALAFLACVLSAAALVAAGVFAARAAAKALDAHHALRARERIEELARTNEALAKLKETQEQLVVADRRVTIGRLAAGVAHEINNPLAWLSGNLEYIAEELAEIRRALPAGDLASADRILGEVAEAVAETQEGGRRVATIVRGLKTFARGDDDRRERVRLDAALDAAIGMAMHEIKQRARLVRSAEETPSVIANEVRLSQVFLNLLINATQALPEGASDRHEIRVSVGGGPDGMAVVEVSDDGCGVAPGDLERIFEPFFTTKPVGVGSGLGLSISRNIVQSYGGDITVESQPGKGTTFRVALPAENRALQPVVT
jgi:signal transduction histidine kinase